MVTPVRSSRLLRNQSAGAADDRPLITVHHKPPKKNTPSRSPAAKAGNTNSISLIVVLLGSPNLPVFLGHPMPRIQAAQGQPSRQQGQRPGVLARMMFIEPDPQSRAEQR